MIFGIVILFLAVLGCAAYLVAIKPRTRGKPEYAGHVGDVLYAHRGLHDNETDAPENTMRAFEKAVEAGYGIELDVQLTKDKVPVIFHDFTLQRMCNVAGKVIDYTYDELQEFAICGTDQRIPKFEDFLNMVAGRVPLVVELKVEYKDLSVCPLADALLRNYSGKYCIESFNPLAVKWYRDHNPEVVRGQLADAFMKGTEYRGALYFALHHLLFNFMTKPDFVAYNCLHPDTLSRKICRKLYKNTAVAWTVKSQKQLDDLQDKFDVFIFDSFVPVAKSSTNVI